MLISRTADHHVRHRKISSSILKQKILYKYNLKSTQPLIPTAAHSRYFILDKLTGAIKYYFIRDKVIRGSVEEDLCGTFQLTSASSILEDAENTDSNHKFYAFTIAAYSSSAATTIAEGRKRSSTEQTLLLNAANALLKSSTSTLYLAAWSDMERRLWIQALNEVRMTRISMNVYARSSSLSNVVPVRKELPHEEEKGQKDEVTQHMKNVDDSNVIILENSTCVTNDSVKDDATQSLRGQMFHAHNVCLEKTIEHEKVKSLQIYEKTLTRTHHHIIIPKAMALTKSTKRIHTLFVTMIKKAAKFRESLPRFMKACLRHMRR